MTADADRDRAPVQPGPDQLAPGQPVPESPAPVHPGLAQPALDQTERVILRSAEEGPGSRGEVVVVGDTTGELTAAALARTEKHAGARVWSWNFSHAESAALTERFAAQCANGRLRVAGGDQPLDLEEFLAEAEANLVLMRLPKALAALDDLARRLAAHARRSEEHTSELQSRGHLVCRLL